MEKLLPIIAFGTTLFSKITSNLWQTDIYQWNYVKKDLLSKLPPGQKKLCLLGPTIFENPQPPDIKYIL